MRLNLQPPICYATFLLQNLTHRIRPYPSISATLYSVHIAANIAPPPSPKAQAPGSPGSGSDGQANPASATGTPRTRRTRRTRCTRRSISGRERNSTSTGERVRYRRYWSTSGGKLSQGHGRA